MECNAPIASRPGRRGAIEKLVKLQVGGKILVRTPAWFLNSANPPRDRGKRGVRGRRIYDGN